MTDTITQEQRHRCMSRIHSKGTKLQENVWHVNVIWECPLKLAVIRKTVQNVVVQLDEIILSLYKQPTNIPYHKEAGTSLFMTAEDDID